MLLPQAAGSKEVHAIAELRSYSETGRIARGVRQILAHEEETGLLVRHHVETIHEEEHISQIAAALLNCDQALQEQK